MRREVEWARASFFDARHVPIYAETHLTLKGYVAEVIRRWATWEDFHADTHTHTQAPTEALPAERKQLGPGGAPKGP